MPCGVPDPGAGALRVFLDGRQEPVDDVVGAKVERHVSDCRAAARIDGSAVATGGRRRPPAR
jgi:hypothetical protein